MEYPIHTIETHSDDRWWAGPQIYDGKTLADMREIAKGILADRAKTDAVRIFGIFNKKRTLLDEVRRSADDDGKGVAGDLTATKTEQGEVVEENTQAKAVLKAYGKWTDGNGNAAVPSGGVEYPVYNVEWFTNERKWIPADALLFGRGTFGEIVEQMSEILKASGVFLGFRVSGAFNGKCEQLVVVEKYGALSGGNPAAMQKGSNLQIDNTDYYRLPCGRYLEDYIEYKQYSFAFGSCMKYEWRKGKKGGESEAKDAKKTGHYIRFIASARGYDEEKVRILLDNALEGARKWDGKIETPTVGSKYWKGGVSDAFI